MSLIDVIKQNVFPLVQSKSKPNWYNTQCMVCLDHTNKGLRGGFYFEEPDVVAYSCFNCSHSARYDPHDDKNSHITKDMRKLLDAYNIPRDQVSEVIRDNLSISPSTKVEVKPSSYEPKVLTLPEHFYELSTASDSDMWKIIATHYLKSRLINPSDHILYLSTGEGFNAKEWFGRIIIPIYKDRKLVYYHGRGLTESVTPKYKTVSGDKSSVLYNYDEIFTYSEKPIFITEGWFDAVLVNGVAILGKFITEEQKYWLNRSSRSKIVIPDRYGDASKLISYALTNGWDISFPDFGKCKDITEAMLKFGKLFVINSIMNNIKSGLSAEFHAKMYFRE